MVRWKLTALVVVLFSLVPATALAQEGTRPARDEFPLRDAARAADAGSATTIEAAGTSGDDPGPVILGALLAMLAGGAATWFYTARRGGLAVALPMAAVGIDRALPRPTAPPRLWAAIADESPRVELTPAQDEQRALSGTNALTPGAPDQPGRAWAAEIGWHLVDGAAQFRVAAHPVDDASEPAVIGASPLLRWPPDGARSGQALTDAVKALDAALVAAGWTPLPRGDAWYARRYTWQPGAQPADAPEARGRSRHRELYEAAFARQADRTRRLRDTLAERLADKGRS